MPDSHFLSSGILKRSIVIQEIKNYKNDYNAD